MQHAFRIPIAGQGSAQHCAHLSTVTEPLPEGSRHFAKLKCASCGAFLRFLPKPENVERWQANAFKLAKLQMRDGLTDWERSFVESLARQGTRFSPRQQEVFDRLCETYLKGGVR
jgi:hypothetical protein